MHFLLSSIKEQGGCWEWQGPLNQKGYGTVKGYKHSLGEGRAHRLSYKLFNGYIPKGLSVCHECDNPKCVNPRHLWAGTNLENQIDAAKKGRKDGKLTIKQVHEIRDLMDSGEYFQREIAARFGVTQAAIGYIVTGVIRNHV